MLTMRAEAEAWVPDTEQLFGDLSNLRRILDQSGERFYKVKTLQRVARCLCPEGRDAESIDAALRLAINRLGANESAEAIAALYGLTPESRGKDLATRWELAAACVNAPNVDSFRTGQAGEILNALVEALVELYAENSSGPDQPHGSSEPLQLQAGAVEGRPEAANDQLLVAGSLDSATVRHSASARKITAAESAIIDGLWDEDEDEMSTEIIPRPSNPYVHPRPQPPHRGWPSSRWEKLKYRVSYLWYVLEDYVWQLEERHRISEAIRNVLEAARDALETALFFLPRIVGAVVVAVLVLKFLIL